jgi:hypothetical protein
MKRIIHRARRAGKTFEAVKLAIETDSYLVVPNRDQALLLSKQYPELRFPITWEEFISTRMRGSWIKKIVIDNLDQCISQMAPVTIEAVTMSAPLDRKEPPIEPSYVENL